MIISPIKTPDQVQQRTMLLQQTMRPEKLPFPIYKEYPIVLDKHSIYSHGLFHEDKLIAHANLWPRTLIDPHGQHITRVGLVGNVATHPEWQGKGLMKRMFAYLEQLAQEQQLSALLLWSDLVEFYQKLGFQSLGKEWIFRLRPEKQDLQLAQELTLEFPAKLPLNRQYLEKLMALRPNLTLTAERSPEEFATLLTIPACDLCVVTDASEPIAFAIIGKGYDMMGVVHEWGSPSPEILDICIAAMARYHEFPEVYLLSPYDLDELWIHHYRSIAKKEKVLEMALIKPLATTTELMSLLDKGFIWGLDSI